MDAVTIAAPVQSIWASADWGMILAILGIALAVTLPGIGSAIGVSLPGQASAGVLSENPDLFSKTLVLNVLPGTQGIYGLLVGFIMMLRLGVLGGGLATVNVSQGLFLLLGAMPIAVVGLISAIIQGRVAAAGIALVARRSDQATKGMVLAAIVETYAVLALLMSFLIVQNVPLG